MFFLRHSIKIFNPIVIFNPIKMMNYPTFGQRFAIKFFPDFNVLPDITKFISFRVSPALNFHITRFILKATTFPGRRMGCLMVFFTKTGSAKFSLSAFIVTTFRAFIIYGRRFYFTSALRTKLLPIIGSCKASTTAKTEHILWYIRIIHKWILTQGKILVNWGRNFNYVKLQ